MSERPIRVLIVDDHPVVRQGLRQLLQSEGIAVCGDVGEGPEAVRMAEATRPDVVIMDVRLTVGCGIEATREIRSRSPTAKVIMLTSFADEEALFASIMAGASGYLLKDVKGFDLIRAIRTVASGQSLLDPAVTQAVLARLRKAARQLKDEKLARLSLREGQVLALVARGLTNRQIGQALHVAEKTVRNYVSSILLKLEVSRRAEAAAYYARHSAARS
ncbi:MAG: response regulator [Actinomycetota bacterium]